MAGAALLAGLAPPAATATAPQFVRRERVARVITESGAAVIAASDHNMVRATLAFPTPMTAGSAR